MNASPDLPADVARIAAELLALAPRARAIAQPLSAADFHAAPAAGRWSVAECLEHLSVSARV